MSKRIFPKVLLIVVAVFGLLVLSNVLSAQGLSQEAFERVKEVQERHTGQLLEIKGVEGTAIGFNQNNRPALKVFVARWDVAGIPKKLDDVPVQVVVTGKFYALPKPETPPGQAKKDPPPSAPTDLTATPHSETEIYLDWDDNTELDLEGYNVYRSTTSGSYGAPIGFVENSSYYDDDAGFKSPIYYYVVTAVDSTQHESDYSNEALATTDPGYEPPLDPTARFERPVPIGVSTGHPDITAGTIGCRVKDSEGNVYALSNNHVYADCNNAYLGDIVLQPGAYDGGVYPDDFIGTLYAFEPIEFGPRGSNTIDAAIALTPAGNLSTATPSDGYVTPNSETTIAKVDMKVKKYGRTTGLTQGKVTGVSGTFRVHYSSGFAIFVDQIVIEGIEGAEFSAGGDSGSLIVTDDPDNPDSPDKRPVGLLFAGSSTMTVANPIDAVLEAFEVTIDGEQ